MPDQIKSHGELIEAQQTVACQLLEQLGFRVNGRFCRIVNALRITAPKDANLSKVPGLTEIQSVPIFEAHTSSSIPFIGSHQAWSHELDFQLTGDNVKVGIIDSGIDYTHATFGGSGSAAFDSNDPTIIEAGSFPTSKIVGGHDFAGDDYDASNEELDEPSPDPDPIDTRENGHGTSVASIVGGMGVLSDGSVYTGQYTNSLDFSQFKLGPGVAPSVELYALKVFGKDGTTAVAIDALEWAADPNGDFDFSDHLDIVNMSLGSEFGFNTSGLINQTVYEEAIRALTYLGCVVVTSAGNSRNTAFITGQPGTAESCISVANSLDDGILRNQIHISAPTSELQSFIAADGAFTAALAETSTLNAEVVMAIPSTACDQLANASDINGKIVMIDRGDCLFVEKIERAQDAGAIGVIMVNHLETAPFAMSGSPEFSVTIPGVMISKADGEILKSLIADELKVRMGGEPPIPAPQLADTLSGNSSRGPSSGIITMKPEISAPGSEITAALSGSGTDTQIVSGTSFAAPHIAGASAILRQKHPDWSVEQIKSALMNTSIPIADANGHLYPASRVGAGRVDLLAAVATEFTATELGGKGGVALSFGGLILTEPTSITREVLFTNHGATPVLVDISINETHPNPGVRVSPTIQQIRALPKQSITVPIQMNLDPHLFGTWNDPTSPSELDGKPRHLPLETNGLIKFSSSENTISLPYHAVLRASLNQTINLPIAEIPRSIIPTNFLIPLDQQEDQAPPLTSALELGAIHPHSNAEPETNGKADILAFGAASDFLANNSLDDTTLYFGIATAAPWTTPQSQVVFLGVELDFDGDGTSEFILTHSNEGSIETDTIYNGRRADDVFVTALWNRSTDEWKAGLPINGYDAQTSSTSPYLSNVIVLPIFAQELGISEPADLRYRVYSFSSSHVDESSRHPTQTRIRDVSDWIPFDPQSPKLSSSFDANSASPVHPDTSLLPLRILDSPTATEATNPTALILHHTNSPNTAFEFIEFADQTDFPDFDKDKMSDQFETTYFGERTAGDPTIDSDGDGQSNLHEFIAGTNPNDSKSVLSTRVTTNHQSFIISADSLPGKIYTIEESDDLKTFIPVTDHILGTGSPFHFQMNRTNSRSFWRTSVQQD